MTDALVLCIVTIIGPLLACIVLAFCVAYRDYQDRNAWLQARIDRLG